MVRLAAAGSPATTAGALPGRVSSERDLASLALALGARRVAGWSAAEEALARGLPATAPEAALEVGRHIRCGRDPLGDALTALRTPVERRPRGATYTPAPIVEAMVGWAAAQGPLARVVDPGAGSGRFVVAAGRRLPGAALVAVELDPLAALLCRAHLAAAGLAGRARVICGDYRAWTDPGLEPAGRGRTLFLGNPPYVRHHLVEPAWKAWLVEAAARLGLRASQLAGLHVHFLVATAERARPGDLGAFITAAEWLDVNYGRLVRELVLGPLGGRAVHVIAPTARPFSDAASTAAITCFEVGARPRSLRLRPVADLDELGALDGGLRVGRERLAAAPRWTPLLRRAARAPAGWIELGELCRVHRGQVTGANRVWIAGAHAAGLPPSVLFPSVTRARELIRAGEVLADPGPLRRVIDLPEDLDRLDADARPAVERFLRFARSQGADRGYVARNRRAWWAVGLRAPAPILATYMARRPPAFVQNRAAARHINIAHGLYPRAPLGEATLAALARHLAAHATVGAGRTYAGGLTKFEPREMERLLVPGPELLAAGADER